MIATFSSKKFMGDTAPTRSFRKGVECRQSALRDYNIKILSSRPISAEYGQLSLDVRGSNPAAVLDFLTVIGVESVTLQPIDADLYVLGCEGTGDERFSKAEL